MESHRIATIGYFPIVGDEMVGVAYCDECWGNDKIAPITQDFEEIGVDSSYGYYQELDTPLHCDGCDALIKTELTKEGYWYLLENLLDSSYWSASSATWATAWSNELANKCINGIGERR